MGRGQPLFADGNRIGFELIGGDALRLKALLLQQLSQQSLRRSSAVSSLDQEVEHLLFIVERPPQSVSQIAYPNDHHVEMPAWARAWAAASKITGNQPTKLKKTSPYRLV
jgi:hypothetical protein